MVWKPQNPGFSIMESVWSYIKRQKTLKQPTEEQPKTREELYQVLCDIWNNLPSNKLYKNCANEHRRIGAVSKVNGGHNKYCFDLDFFVQFNALNAPGIIFKASFFCIQCMSGNL